MAPLYHLTKQHTPFVWSKECNNSFDTVKQLLTNAPVLQLPSINDHFILETDASDIGIGNCLKVKRHNIEHAVSYHSAKLNDNEQKWNIVEKEAFAIVTAVRKNRHYLLRKNLLSAQTEEFFPSSTQQKHQEIERSLLGQLN